MFIRRPALRPPRPPHAAKEAGPAGRPPALPAPCGGSSRERRRPWAAGRAPPWPAAALASPPPVPRMAPAAAPAGQQYFRSDSSDSAAYMLGSPSGSEPEPPAQPEKRRRRQRCSPVWLAVAAMGIVALQIASATGLFVYFTMSIAKVGRGGGRSGRPAAEQRSAGASGGPRTPFARPRGGGGGLCGTGSGGKCSATERAGGEQSPREPQRISGRLLERMARRRRRRRRRFRVLSREFPDVRPREAFRVTTYESFYGRKRTPAGSSGQSNFGAFGGSISGKGFPSLKCAWVPED